MTYPTVELSTICNIDIGRTPSRAVPEYWEGGIHPWASIADLSKGRLLKTTKECITDKAIVAAGMKLVRAGTVLMSFKLSIGKVSIATIDTFTNEAIAALSIKDARIVDVGYLARALEGLDFEGVGDRAAMGATLNKKSLAKVAVPLPSLAEQKHISEILDLAEEVRNSRRRAVDGLRRLEEAIFYEMFGDPIVNTRGLPTVALGQIIRVSSGSGLTSSNQKGGDYPVYGGNGVNGWHDKFTVPENTIVIGRVGVYCGAVHVTDRSSWVTDNALVVTLKKPVNRTYLAAALKVANLNQYAGRSAQPLVSGSRIYPVEILDPAIEEQNAYEGKIRQLDRTLSSCLQAVRVSDELFSALQNNAFQGEL